MKANSFLERYGPWALVTGASSGIGAEFARQLAARHFNLVTVARRRDELQRQADALRREHGVTVKVIAVDLADTDAVRQLLDEIDPLPLGLLVANAGIGQKGEFTRLGAREQLGTIGLNIVAPTLLAHSVARGMIGRRRGGIILTGSTMGFVGVPFMATYAATKAYVLSLGEALHAELAGHGVDVCVLAPGPTATPMVADFDLTKFPMKPMPVRPVVATALAALGRRPVAIPGVANKLMVASLKRLLSRPTASAMFGSMMKQMLQAPGIHASG